MLVPSCHIGASKLARSGEGRVASLVLVGSLVVSEDGSLVVRTIVVVLVVVVVGVLVGVVVCAGVTGIGGDQASRV